MLMLKNILRFVLGFLGFLTMMSDYSNNLSFGLSVSLGMVSVVIFVWALYPLMNKGIENQKINRRNFSPNMKERRKRWKKKEKLQKQMMTTQKFRSSFLEKEKLLFPGKR